MADCFKVEKRSEIMSHVKRADTAVEIKVRSLLHRLGYRFRLHVSSLPGKPDIVLPRFKRVVFVHGCFWHRCPQHARTPKSRIDFWQNKLDSNARRDRSVARKLRSMGWAVWTLWEHDFARRRTDLITAKLGRRIRAREAKLLTQQKIPKR